MFGSFQLLPAQQLLLEGDVEVRVGSRALAILTVLVERAGELVTKNELMERVWPGSFVDENALRVHVAGLRRALGDGQGGRRFVANIPGRGYQFVAPVEASEVGGEQLNAGATGSRPHNLPLAQSRVVGRDAAIRTLGEQLRERRLVTIVGAGGIGKTTVALALADRLLPAFEDGVWFAELAHLAEPRLVPDALASALGLAVDTDDAIPSLIDFLREKQLMIVLDNCEHVIDMAAWLAERILAFAPRVQVLATSREPLRAKGEHVHRLPPLETPSAPAEVTAAQCLAFPAVQLFVERASAINDGFALSDADAPVVAEICTKLGGIALAIELAAARVDALGVRQLSALLDDRFQILNQGRRAADARHRSLAAALDWSYDLLSQTERSVLRRISVFVGGFSLDAAVAVAADVDGDAVEAVANLVAKSLIVADIGDAVVRYRLLDPTRAYVLEKLREAGEADQAARRHAEFFRDYFASIETRAQIEASPEDLARYRQDVDNVRAALDWSFSPAGDPSVGVVLTAVFTWFWLNLALYFECRERTEQALDRIAAGAQLSVPLRLQSLVTLSIALTNMMGPVDRIRNVLATALQIAEDHGELGGHLWVLWALWSLHLNIGACREAQSVAERYCAIAPSTGDPANVLPGFRLLGTALQWAGDQNAARSVLARALEPPYSADDPQHPVWPQQHRAMSLAALARTLWLQGFADQARETAREGFDEALMDPLILLRFEVLRLAVCPVAFMIGDQVAAEEAVTTMSGLAAGANAVFWKLISQLFEGTLHIRRGAFETGLAVLRTALATCEKTGWKPGYPEYLGAVAQGLAGLGRYAEAIVTIDKALAAADCGGERWYVAELLRIKGECLLGAAADDAVPTAEGVFQEALALARTQGALSWELRVALSLAHLNLRRGRAIDARGVLAPIYQRFTEGFDTADLQAARVLLESL